jgi:hypothetical protein
VRLPPGGEATLRGWGLESWHSPILQAVSIEVVLADELLLGGEPVARWTRAGTAARPPRAATRRESTG